jgi:hypothetical protein
VREQDLRQLLQRQPFPLLRLHLTGGLVFEITDPEVPVTTRSTIEIPLPPEGGRQREAVISLLHIIWIEIIDPAP